MIFLVENLKIPLNASIAFVRTNTVWAKPKPLYKKRDNKSVSSRNVISFFLLGDMFASKRDILALLVRYIVASLQCDMI